MNKLSEDLQSLIVDIELARDAVGEFIDTIPKQRGANRKPDLEFILVEIEMARKKAYSIYYKSLEEEKCTNDVPNGYFHW